MYGYTVGTSMDYRLNIITGITSTRTSLAQ